MIEFRDLVVRYPRADVAALGGVSLVAPRGRITAVAGPNGSGKSTLVRALLRRVTPASGLITIDGEPLASVAPARFATLVAVVPQREEPAFPLSVREYVELGRHPHSGAWGRTGADDRAAVDRAMDEAEVAALGDRLTDALSGGEWQRVRIARALAQGAGAVVLDEPTTYLDVAHEMAVFELASRLAAGGAAVLLVSHQLNLVARFADHVVLLHRGIVAASGTPSEVMQAPTLERVYEWPLVVTRDPATGAPALVPLRRRA